MNNHHTGGWTYDMTSQTFILFFIRSFLPRPSTLFCIRSIRSTVSLCWSLQGKVTPQQEVSRLQSTYPYLSFCVRPKYYYKCNATGTFSIHITQICYDKKTKKKNNSSTTLPSYYSRVRECQVFVHSDDIYFLSTKP